MGAKHDNEFNEISKGWGAGQLCSHDRRRSGVSCSGVARSTVAPPEFPCASLPGKCTFLTLGLLSSFPSLRLQKHPEIPRERPTGEEREGAGSGMLSSVVHNREPLSRIPSTCSALHRAGPGKTKDDWQFLKINRASMDGFFFFFATFTEEC